MSKKDSKEDFKVKELVKLKTAAGTEYQEAMLTRVEYFAKKNAEKSVFNNFLQNTIVKGLSTVLDLKLSVDKALGEDNLKKVHDVIDQLLLLGL